MASKRNKPSQVRNRKRRIKKKRASPGSAKLDKETLIEGALPAVVENALVHRMICHDRVIWPVTETIRVKTVERATCLLDSPDPYVALGAMRNVLAMEGQNIKALESPAVTNNNTQVNVQVNQTKDANGNPVEIPTVELTHDTRLARIRFILHERRRLAEVARIADTGGTGENGQGANGNAPDPLGSPTRPANDGVQQ